MGGSLGGLTAALFLRDAGCDVAVYERSCAPLRDRGAGIVVHPATIRYLIDSGMRRTGEIGEAARVLRYLGADGEIASEQPCRYRFTSYYALYADLLACFGSDRYHIGREVTGSRPATTVSRSAWPAAPPSAPISSCAPTASARRRGHGCCRRSKRPTPATLAGAARWARPIWASPHARCFENAITYNLMPHSHLLTYPIPALGEAVARGCTTGSGTATCLRASRSRTC